MLLGNAHRDIAVLRQDRHFGAGAVAAQAQVCWAGRLFVAEAAEDYLATAKP